MAASQRREKVRTLEVRKSDDRMGGPISRGWPNVDVSGFAPFVPPRFATNGPWKLRQGCVLGLAEATRFYS